MQKFKKIIIISNKKKNNQNKLNKNTKRFRKKIIF